MTGPEQERADGERERCRAGLAAAAAERERGIQLRMSASRQLELWAARADACGVSGAEIGRWARVSRQAVHAILSRQRAEAAGRRR